MRSVFSPTPRPRRLIPLCLALSLMIAAASASAVDAVESLTGYAVTEYQAAPTGESLVSFDWDSTGALYYMTGDPYWGPKLNVYRKFNNAVTTIYQNGTLISGSRVTTVGSFVYFNDGGTGDYSRGTANYYAYDPAQGGDPVLSLESSPQTPSLWGIDTRDGSQFFASGTAGFTPTGSIYYMPTPPDGILNSLVNLGEIGEYSGPVAFDREGNLYYAQGYVTSGQAKIFRWTAAELAAAIASPSLAPLSPANHEWASLPATFTGANGMAIDASGNLYVTANGAFGELLLYRPALSGASSIPNPLARYSASLGTLRLRDGKIYMSCAAGIYQMSVPFSVSLSGEAQVHAVAGRKLTLSVNVTGGERGFSCQWFETAPGKADSTVGDDSPSLTITPTLADRGKGYYCEVSEAGMTVTSPTYTLEVLTPTPAASGFALAGMVMGMCLVGMKMVRRRRPRATNAMA